jgi:hypothetical protein
MRLAFILLLCSLSASFACGTPGHLAVDGAETSEGDTGAPTWTQLYDGIFGPTGSSSCSLNGGCHTTNQGGFTCGTTSDTCYTGLVNAGLIAPGGSAATSVLVDPSASPLCTPTLGGTMPPQGACPTTAQIAQIQAWLATGAPEN